LTEPQRGGRQVIPRPDTAEPGPPSPWAHLPIEARRPSLAEVVRGLDAGGPPQPSQWEPPVGAHRSAVLVPLFEEDGLAHVILTRRSWHLRNHKGEISFPGGRQDDGETIVEAALREAEEEIALDIASVEIVGELDHLATWSSNSSIVPFVGVLPGRPAVLVPNPTEVEAVVITSLAELLADGVHRTELWAFPVQAGIEGSRPMHFFELVGDTVWGATARILMNLLTRVLRMEHPG
jgi:8-oxo-dGTP pyrophosphatase MutT (NUDIX family)